MENAFSTQVCDPPFLNRLPFAEAMTTGLTLSVITAGACPEIGFPDAAAGGDGAAGDEFTTVDSACHQNLHGEMCADCLVSTTLRPTSCTVNRAGGAYHPRS